MRQVELVSISTETQLMGDIRDHMEFQTCDPKMERARVDCSPEFFPNLIEIETAPIIKVIDSGIAHYVCVKRKVWEYLYCIENPVTAKSQEIKIKKLSESSKSWESEAWRTAESYKKFRETTLNTSLLTRIKWVFTGVKF